jgi:hypothetical protein
MSKIDQIMGQYRLCGDLRIDPFSVVSGKLDGAESKLRAMIEDALKAPDGWKLVPVEPTRAMLEAGVEENIDSDTEIVSTKPCYQQHQNLRNKS